MGSLDTPDLRAPRVRFRSTSTAGTWWSRIWTVLSAAHEGDASSSVSGSQGIRIGPSLIDMKPNSRYLTPLESERWRQISAVSVGVRFVPPLLHRHRLGEVARLVDLAAVQAG